jgi:hypothetical protein
MGTRARAFLKATSTCSSVFQVYTRGNASTVSNLAYTSGPLGMHTDLNSMERCPDVQILHTIKQTADCGGANQLADGLAIAQLLRDEQPEVSIAQRAFQ